MMRGTALVATKTGGTPEIVRDGVTAYLVEPGDPVALGDRLLAVLGNRDLAERMGAAGRQVALNELTTDRMIDRFEEIYRELIA
jgi:glycosyltransferase involved in cell wall biosynthesis